MQRFLLLILSLIVVCSTVSSGQLVPATASAPPAVHQVEDAQWQKIKEGLEYSEKPIEKKKDAPTNTQSNTSTPSNWGNPFDLFKGIGVLGKIVFFILVVGLLGSLLYALAGQGFFLGNKNLNGELSFDLNDLENNIHESDLDRFLREAIQKGDYRAAIRVYYLALIKEASIRQLIHWKREKTNAEYLREMRKYAPLYEPFREATLTYDYAWYGNITVQQADYERVSLFFNDLLQKVKTTQAI